MSFAATSLFLSLTTPSPGAKAILLACNGNAMCIRLPKHRDAFSSLVRAPRAPLIHDSHGRLLVRVEKVTVVSARHGFARGGRFTQSGRLSLETHFSGAAPSTLHCAGTGRRWVMSACCRNPAQGPTLAPIAGRHNLAPLKLGGESLCF